MTDADVCIIGSGAGAAPVALTLSRAGKRVIVLEKGPWFKEGDFFRDELAETRLRKLLPDLLADPQVVELARDDGGWDAWPTHETGWDFWNGSLVGGSSNLMSGFFHRLKPIDFRLKSELGPIEGATVEDWPFDYDVLEPYYDRVEKEVGISGRVVAHPFADRRSSPDFPLPPMLEHPVAGWVDDAARGLGLHPFPLPRAILSRPRGDRASCANSAYCGGYGCPTGAKGSARAALLDPAVQTGLCQIRPRSHVVKLETDARGRASHAVYRDELGEERRLAAKVFVVACQAIESARLLLLSTGSRHSNGIGNRYGQVGKNLLFCASGSGDGELQYMRFSSEKAQALRNPIPNINRAIQDWYLLEQPGGGRRKGGTLDFLFVNPSPITLAESWARGGERLRWGNELKQALEGYFRGGRHILFEVFADWVPNPDSRVTLSPTVKDRWGNPVAMVRIGRHPRNREVVSALVEKGRMVLEAVGAVDITTGARGGPATNLQAGGCRAGVDPKESVVDAECRVHDCNNVYVTDGSFMPTGGSVPFTWTIYANAFRVADAIVGAV